MLKTVGITAVLTFLTTQALGWLFERIADDVATAASPVIVVDSSGPIAEPWDVVVPQPPEALETAQVRSGAMGRWALNQGGGPANAVKVDLTTWGNRDYPIRLDAIRASEVDCQPAPAWTIVEASVGGAVPERVVTIDLDSGNYDGVPASDPSLGVPFTFPLQVSRSSLELFSVRIHTAASNCSFQLEILFRDNGEPQAYTIDDNGAPFRVVSPKAAAARMQWHLAEDGLWSPTTI